MTAEPALGGSSAFYGMLMISWNAGGQKRPACVPDQREDKSPRRSGLGDQALAIRPAQATAGMPNRQRDRHPRPWLTRDAAVPLTVTWFSLPSGEGLRCRSIDHPCLLPAPGPQPGPAPSGRPHPYPSLPAKPCEVLPVPSCRDTSWFP